MQCVIYKPKTLELHKLPNQFSPKLQPQQCHAQKVLRQGAVLCTAAKVAAAVWILCLMAYRYQLSILPLLQTMYMF